MFSLEKFKLLFIVIFFLSFFFVKEVREGIDNSRQRLEVQSSLTTRASSNLYLHGMRTRRAKELINYSHSLESSVAKQSKKRQFAYG